MVVMLPKAPEGWIERAGRPVSRRPSVASRVWPPACSSARSGAINCALSAAIASALMTPPEVASNAASPPPARVVETRTGPTEPARISRSVIPVTNGDMLLPSTPSNVIR